MPIGIGASGTLGFAFEATQGTYVAPTVYFPIYSENLQYKQGGKQRRPIRGLADVIGVVQGNSWVEGDITMEALPLATAYWAYISRNTVIKTGAGPYVYTCTPSAAAVGPINSGKGSASLTIRRNGIVFGYVGCIVTGMEFTIEDQVLMLKISVIGYDEATQSNPTDTYGTEVPFGAGMYTLSVGGSQVTDTDTFTFTVDDGGEAVHRVNTVRTPVAVRWGERSLTCKLERDFQARTEYDAFKSYTANVVQLVASQNANNKIELLMSSNIKENWDIGLDGQGDLVRASIDYIPVYDTATSKAYELKITSATSIT